MGITRTLLQQCAHGKVILNGLFSMFQLSTPALATTDFSTQEGGTTEAQVSVSCLVKYFKLTLSAGRYWGNVIKYMQFQSSHLQWDHHSSLESFCMYSYSFEQFDLFETILAFEIINGSQLHNPDSRVSLGLLAVAVFNSICGIHLNLNLIILLNSSLYLFKFVMIMQYKREREMTMTTFNNMLILPPAFHLSFICYLYIRLFLYQLSVGAWIGIGIAIAVAVGLVIFLYVFMSKGPTKETPSPQPDVPMEKHNEAVNND